MPSGFVVTAAAYLAALDAAGVRQLRERVVGLDVDDPAALARVAAELQGLVRAARLPDEVRGSVLDAYHELGAELVAVRMATAEDTASRSPA